MVDVIFDRTISPNENMVAPNTDDYFLATETAFKCIVNGLSYSNHTTETIKTVLDFGCAHGRVYRILTAGFPNAHHTACDLIADGAKFCAETFGGSWVKSYEDVHLTSFDREFDFNLDRVGIYPFARAPVALTARFPCSKYRERRCSRFYCSRSIRYSIF